MLKKIKKILVINSGSATLKFKIYSISDEKDKSDNFKLLEEITGIIERIGIGKSFIEMKELTSGSFIKQTFPDGLKTHSDAFTELAKRIKNYLPDIKFVGHRIVHGGDEFTNITRLTSRVLDKLKKYNKLAPLHNPVNLRCVDEAIKILPSAKHFGVFDTAYYRDVPEYAYRYALPEEYLNEYKIRRYGFHGTSHKYLAIEGAKKIKQPLKKLKIISCHLGSGCSITGTKNGVAVGNTMGFTPLQGLMMSTRVGDIDAAVPLFMIKKLGMTPEEVDNVLNKKSGLLGVAGTMDMREILYGAGKKVVGYKVKRKFTKKEKDQARLALDMFVYNIVRYIGQFTAIMGGVDLIVFSGGIGERSPVVRQMVTRQVRHLGKFKSIVVPAGEELMIARELLEK